MDMKTLEKDRETSLNIVLYGKPESLFDTGGWIKYMDETIIVSLFHSLPFARRYIEQHEVDLILLDGDDDAVDWQYLVVCFRQIDPKIRIVLLSSSEEQSVRAYEAGLFDYLLKPVQRKQLERIFAKCESATARAKHE